MNVETGWKLDLDGEWFLRAQGETLARLVQRPARRVLWEATLDEARRLIQPAAVWDVFPIREVRHTKLVLANGAEIGGGPLTAVMGGASELIVAVCTIGGAISDRVAEYQRDRQLWQGLLLSDLGSWAVDLVRQRLCRQFEEDAASRGWHVSPALSPGESVWPIEEQAVIFSLLDAGQIGISLNLHMVMSPLKSLSLVVGRGSQPMGAAGASHCDYCSMAGRCAYRDRRGA